MHDKSALEIASGNLGTKAAANAVAALGATITPLAAFVPFLIDALASGRQAQRLEQMFSELTALTNAHSEQLKTLTDDQYKVVSEVISAAFYTVNQEKLQLLKRAATNAFLDSEAVANVSDSLSRVVRDISAAEAAFIMRNFKYELIAVSEKQFDPASMPPTLVVRPQSEEEIILSGLINLGLLYSKASRWDVVAFEWSPLVVKFLRVIKDA